MLLNSLEFNSVSTHGEPGDRIIIGYDIVGYGLFNLFLEIYELFRLSFTNC